MAAEESLPEIPAAAQPTSVPASPALASHAGVSAALLKAQLEKLASDASPEPTGISLGAGLLWLTGGRPAEDEDEAGAGGPTLKSVREAAKAALDDIKTREDANDPELLTEGA